jgi:predicted nucleotide-binding protein (sugar kinase/HSP70/actin superfamily)
MGKYTNSFVLGQILQSLYHVASRRTTQSFAAKVIGSIIKTLEQRYDFLIYVKINDRGELSESEAISILPEIESVKRELVGRAIEDIIRVVYMDIICKSGLFYPVAIDGRF